MLIYQFHKINGYSLKVVPFMDKNEHGIFATRSPKRPNKIGISIVRLNAIVENVLDIKDIDILSGSPLLDIKPYFSMFDSVEKSKNGWLDQKKDLNIYNQKSDNRFL